jgi:hypothetical protein
MGTGLVAVLRQRNKEVHLQLAKIGRIILNLWAISFVLDQCFQWLSDQYNSIYVLTLIYFLYT